MKKGELIALSHAKAIMKTVIQLTIVHTDKPKLGRTAVCASLINFSILDDWEAITGCHFNRTSVPLPRVDFSHLAGLA